VTDTTDDVTSRPRIDSLGSCVNVVSLPQSCNSYNTTAWSLIKGSPSSLHDRFQELVKR
jgi:hypothetical protein